jgi:hypothetical protein
MGDFTQTAKASQSPTGWAPTMKNITQRVKTNMGHPNFIGPDQ